MSKPIPSRRVSRGGVEPKGDRVGRFGGFPKDTFAFYRELARSNSRDWFLANSDRYKESVLVPARAFVAALGDRLRGIVPQLRFDAQRLNGAGSILRIQRDVRFTKDRAPYKTNLGMLFWLDQGRKKQLCPHFYVGLYPEGGLVHAGMRSIPSPLIHRYRSAVARRTMGGRLRGILASLGALGLRTGSQRLSRVPAGFPADHPQADLLCYGGLYAETGYVEKRIVTSPSVVDACFDHCRQMAPLVTWLAEALGDDRNTV